MTPLGPSARELIEAAEGADSPGADDKERMRARLAASIGASIVGAAAAGAAVKGVSASTTATAMLKGATGGAAGTTLFGKILAAVLLTGALSVGYVAGRRSDVEATRATPAEPSAVVPIGRGVGTGQQPVGSVATVQPPFRDEPTNTVATSRTPATTPFVTGRKPAPPAVASQAALNAPAAAAAPASTVGDSTEGEAALFQRARAAIDAGDGVTALDALDAAERKFPGGLLADQRHAERIIAMCTIAKVPVTRERAERFLADRPRSQQADRIRRACGLP